MKRIKKLTPEVISSIAAGEVIQRPVHVIKELVDNAIDAEANEITVLLKDAGLTQIEVIDNGHGIEPEDLELAVTPHATSKLKILDDLKQITSHGFRGEALASIGQVSQLTIRSRLKTAQAGYQIGVRYGEIGSAKPVGMPQGTRITVTKLFEHAPVRQDFLKQSKAELRKIVDWITTIALAHPDIGFKLKHNQREILSVPPSQSLIDRTQKLLGTKIFSQFLPISYDSEGINITGFISQPSLWTKRPDKQFIFINQRPVKHTALQRKLHQLANQVSANQLYPLYALHFQIDPAEIDVNIHPQKSTIEVFILDQVYQALESAITPELSQRPITYTGVGPINFQVSDKKGDYKTKTFRQGLLKEYHQSTQQRPKLVGEIQQLANLYLLAPTNNGLLLVDQHALHERLLYDELSQLYQNKKQSLLQEKISLSLVFDLPPSEASLLEENKDIFIDLGIEIEPFGKQSFKVNSIPKLFADHDIFSFITEVLDQAVHDDDLEVDSQTEAILASMACRLAIKAGDYVSPEFRIELLEKLLTSKHAGTCPHGRPVSIRITLNELNKLFKRT